MKNLLKPWTWGIEYILYDDLISYYAFFSAILAEITFLWAFQYDFAKIFTILLSICIVNVIFAAWSYGHDGNLPERVTHLIFCGVFVVAFVIGCFYSILASIALFVIPFAFVPLWMFINGFLISIPCGYSEEHIRVKIFKLFNAQKIVYGLVQFVKVVGPVIIIAIFLFQTPIALGLKIALPLFYLFLAPAIAYMEDSLATLNIFELFMPY